MSLPTQLFCSTYFQGRASVLFCQFGSYHSNLDDYKDINFGIGIDIGNIIATKVGIGGDDTTKDLIWLGNAVNRSTKISDECEAPYHVGISDAVYNKLPNNLISYTTKEKTYFGFQDVKKNVWIQQTMRYNDEWETFLQVVA